MSAEDLLIPEFAKRADVSDITVRRRVMSGEIAARKIVGRWRIPESELARFMAGEIERPKRDASSK